jgi:hypothetical protein
MGLTAIAAKNTAHVPNEGRRKSLRGSNTKLLINALFIKYSFIHVLTLR